MHLFTKFSTELHKYWSSLWRTNKAKLTDQSKCTKFKWLKNSFQLRRQFPSVMLASSPTQWTRFSYSAFHSAVYILLLQSLLQNPIYPETAFCLLLLFPAYVGKHENCFWSLNHLIWINWSHGKVAHKKHQETTFHGCLREILWRKPLLKISGATKTHLRGIFATLYHQSKAARQLRTHLSRTP